VDFVHERLVPYGGDVLGFEVFEALDGGAFGGFSRDNLDARVVLLEPFGDAHERARGANPRNEVGHAPLGVAPDFLGCGFIVRAHIRLVRELVGHEVLVWALAGYFAGEVFGAVHALVRLAKDYFGAYGVQDLPSFQSHVFGHDEEEVVAFYAADEC